MSIRVSLVPLITLLWPINSTETPLHFFLMLSEDGMTRLGGYPTGGGPEHLRVSRHLLWYVCRESSSQRGCSTNVARLGKALGSAVNPEPGISPSSSCIQVPPTVHNSAINHWLVSPLSTRCHSAADVRVLDFKSRHNAPCLQTNHLSTFYVLLSVLVTFFLVY